MQDFLTYHPDSPSYNEQPQEIQTLLDPSETLLNHFGLLADNKPLVCMACFPLGKWIKLTFVHSFNKTTILTLDARYFALLQNIDET